MFGSYLLTMSQALRIPLFPIVVYIRALKEQREDAAACISLRKAVEYGARRQKRHTSPGQPSSRKWTSAKCAGNGVSIDATFLRRRAPSRYGYGTSPPAMPHSARPTGQPCPERPSRSFQNNLPNQTVPYTADCAQASRTLATPASQFHVGGRISSLNVTTRLASSGALRGPD